MQSRIHFSEKVNPAQARAAYNAALRYITNRDRRAAETSSQYAGVRIS